MKTRTDNPCRTIRQKKSSLMDTICNRVFVSFLRRHIEHCPRCSRRLMDLNRVYWALLLTRTQSHRQDLLARANTAALHMLKHGLRNAPNAEPLLTAKPEPAWFIRNSAVLEKVFNVAACLLVVSMIKIGATSFLKNVHQDGTKVVHNYYSRNLGQDMADDLMKS